MKHKLLIALTLTISTMTAWGRASDSKVVPQTKGTHCTFVEGLRYSELIINSRLNDFKANTTAAGVGVFDATGHMTTAPTGTKNNLDYVPGLVAKAVIELVDTTIKYCHHGDAITVDMNSGADDLLWQWTPTTGITNPNTQTSDADISSGRTYHVIAKDRYGCQADTAQVDVTIFEQPVADIRVNPENGCAPFPVIFRAVDVPDECDIRWRVYGENAFDTTYTQSSQLHLTLGDAGYYDVNLWLSTAPGCSDSLTLHNAVHVSDFPHAMLSFSPDEPNNGETVYFYNESTGSDINSYFWNFGDGGTSTTQNPEHAYHVTASDNMTVHFVVTNIDGCEDDTTFVIPVVDEFSLYVPNSFTPNEDGVNDVFQPIARDVAFYRLKIYDRYGSLFFITEDTEAFWDGTIGGKPAPAGVYVWTIEYIRYSNPNRTLLKKGSVTLVR